MTAVIPEAAACDVNPAALYDVLNCASMAVMLAEAGDPRAAGFMRQARTAESMAFPAGTRQARALSVILAAAGRVPEVTS